MKKIQLDLQDIVDDLSFERTLGGILESHIDKELREMLWDTIYLSLWDELWVIIRGNINGDLK